MPDEANYFYARLCTKAQLALDVTSKTFPTVSLSIGDKSLKLNSYKQIQGWLLKHPELLNTSSNLVLFPKTSRDCVLIDKTHLHLVVPEDQAETFEEGFEALGQLAFFNKEEASLGIRIHPNPEGRLKKSFMLRVVASLDLLDRLPAIGSGVKLKGELKTKSLRLLVTEAKEVDLPAMKVT